MVLLTMTPKMVEAVKRYYELGHDCLEGKASGTANDEFPTTDCPNLRNACVGMPISHGQVLDISRVLRARSGPCPPEDDKSFSLEALLRGAKVYVAPKKPRAEPTSEYKELMARLRHEQESRSYNDMINQPKSTTQLQTFGIGGPGLDQSQLQSDEDDMTYADVNRQVTLIINILVTVVACSIAIWLIARSWSAPKRLALSMGGSGLIAIAEVVIYSGYIRRLDEAKGVEKKKTETSVITNTWVIERKSKKE